MGAIYKNDLFYFIIDKNAFLYSRDIVTELIERFPISVLQAIELVNDRLKHLEIIDEQDLFYHEIPEVWAKNLYWGHDQAWWKKEEERKKYNLADLKPIRPIETKQYELWEGIEEVDDAQINSIIFISNQHVDMYLKLNFIGSGYKQTWVIEAEDYNFALNELYKYKNWGNYHESH